MAKGDSGRAQKQIDTQGRTSQNYLSGVQGKIGQSNDMFTNNYQQGVQNSNDLYNQLKEGYSNFASGAMGGYGGAQIGLDPTYQGYLNRGLAGYENFANTGGLSAQDQQDLRDRAIAPTRAIYANAQDNIRRQKALQGGYAPNAIAAQAKVNRDLSSAVGDANVNANASIAQMIQQGKLAGLGGMQQGAFGGLDRALEVARANQASSNAAAGSGRANMLAGLSGLSNLYSATPGLANLYGGQTLQSNNQLLNSAGLQNQLGGEIMNAQMQKSQIPGDFQQAMGNIGSAAGLAGGIAGLFI